MVGEAAVTSLGVASQALRPPERDHGAATPGAPWYRPQSPPAALVERLH